MAIDYRQYGLTDGQAAAVESLTEEQLEYAYRLRKHQYLLQDARDHAADVLEDDPGALGALGDGDYEELARRFQDGQDCGVPEDGVWERVVLAYIDERRGN